MSPGILVVEDDTRIAELVVKNLTAAGFECRTAGDGLTALHALAQSPPALVILDISLPGIDGHEITRRLRRNSNVPILMLTARSTDADKVLGFELGADAYLTKPFSTQELVARVRALLRRAEPSQEAALLRCGDLHIDTGRRQVHRAGVLVETTSLEFDVLRFLAQRPGRVFSRDQLMQQVWGNERLVDARAIDSLVSRLRRKIEPDAANPRYIQTVWGAGYRFREQEEA